MQDKLAHRKSKIIALFAEYYCLTTERRQDPPDTYCERGTERWIVSGYCAGLPFQKRLYDKGDDKDLT